eukprot:TRINITY_DN4553_c0_g1_i3.p1 TRINITY_DN4553_c0_g1~~TRINITY_DN4553_c0_g1_i3.p1  ORF type:complete len:155 (+),score=39.97 TRINITY_DN4553_c0_g1_i3:342-806(+)
MAQQGGQEALDITRLSLDELKKLHKELGGDVQRFTESYKSLKMAESRFRDSKATIGTFTDEYEGKETLVPLTGSMYVPGVVSQPDHYIIDVGTGYYVGMNREGAQAFMDRKIKMLSSNAQSVMGVVKQRQENQEMVYSVLRQKAMLQQQQQAAN